MRRAGKKREETELRRVGHVIKQLLHAFRGHVDFALRDYGVTAAQVRLLHEIDLAPGATGARLARALHVSPQSAQAQLARAAAAGWVVRGRSAENERLVTMRLTAEGQRLLTHARGVAAGIEQGMWAGIERSEVSEVLDVLTRALHNLEG